MSISRRLDITTYPVMPTPLLEDQRIDFTGLDACVNYYLNAGMPGLTVLGSGGELPYFSDEEQVRIVAHVRHTAGSEMLLIAGVNAYSTSQAVSKIDTLKDHADVILLLLSDYYGAHFSDYKQAFTDIAAQSALPLLLYYFPQVTGQFFNSEQLTDLLGIPNVVGIKDSSMHLPTAISILKKSPSALYFSGLSLLLEKLYPVSHCGAICPISAILPQQALAYQQALAKGNLHEAKTLRIALKMVFPIINKPKMSATTQYAALNTLIRSPIPLLRKVSSPHANSKEALRLLGVPIGPTVRSPLPALRASDVRHIDANLRTAGALK